MNKHTGFTKLDSPRPISNGVDKVFIEDLRLSGKHGVAEHERTTTVQEFVLDIAAELDMGSAAKSDDIADTMDYMHFCEIARDVISNNSFYLIERVAETIADRIFENERITSVSISIRKPNLLDNGVPGIAITRTR